MANTWVVTISFTVKILLEVTDVHQVVPKETVLPAMGPAVKHIQAFRIADVGRQGMFVPWTVRSWSHRLGSPLGGVMLFSATTRASLCRCWCGGFSSFAAVFGAQLRAHIACVAEASASAA